MNNRIEGSPASKFWAYVAVLAGGILFISGLGLAFRYLGLSLFYSGGDVLSAQLGNMAGMFLGLIGGGYAILHGVGSISRRPSQKLRLPPIHYFWLLFALVLGLGNTLLNFNVSTEFLFPILFLLGAALPTLGVVAWVARRLGWPITKRQAWMALISGSTISIIMTIFLASFMAYLIYIFVYPLGFIAFSISELMSYSGPDFMERLFFSPVIIIILLITALEVPFPEEFAKALAIPMFGRKRIMNERTAFLIGVCSGAGFAILENMLYEGIYAQYSGWTWGGITLLRGIGSVLHPLGTGIVAVGWVRARRHGWSALLKAYMLAVGLHTLWNGGFQPLLYLTGLERYAELDVSFSFYGEAIGLVLILYLVGLSAGLWWLIWRITASFAADQVPELSISAISPRRMAIWSLLAALVIIPIGAALGPAWPAIKEIILAGVVR